MPIHDWTRILSGIYHDFHVSWIYQIRSALNDGILPDDYYALAEQRADGPIPDVLALERRFESIPDDPNEGWEVRGGAQAVAITEKRPQARFRDKSDASLYAIKAQRITIRHASGDEIVAYIELVSPGNKQTERHLEFFLKKLHEAVDRGCHLLVIDPFPPGKHDPQGIHHRFWSAFSTEVHGVTADQPVGLSAYHSLELPDAFFERIAIGEALPPMPLFLSSTHYVDVPLEETYWEAWKRVPRRWRSVIESPPLDTE